MELGQEDVKTASDSSQEAAVVGAAAKQDAMQSESSTEQTATQQDANAKEQTLADHLLETFGSKKTAAEATSAKGEDAEKAKEESGSESEQDSEAKAKADKEAEAVTKKEDGEGEDKSEAVEDKGPIPYERFQEVVHARQQLEETVKQVTPQVENYKRITSYCETSGITPEQFHAALETQALLNTNPQEALKRLMPIVEQLQGLSGDKLSPDLQAAVDSGDITLAYAKRLAQAEAQKTYGERSSQVERQRMVQQQQETFRTSLAGAAQAWEQSKRTSDPDYIPKAKDSEPDGKWEMARHVFNSLLHQTDQQGQLLNPVKSASDMTALMERAYKQVNGSFTRLVPKAPTRKSLSSNSSSASHNKKNVEDASTMQEAIQIALAQRG